MLTQKQEDFCVNYIKLRHSTNAAIAAGYSSRSAYEIGHQNLNKVEIKTRISELREVPAESAKMLVQEREERLSEIARANILEFKGDSEVIADVRFGDNINAIKELNKMDNIYNTGTQVYAPSITINVGTDRALELTERLLKGGLIKE